MSGLRLSAIIIFFLTVAGVSQARHCAVHDVSIRDDVLAGSAIMPTIEYETPYVVVGSGIPPSAGYEFNLGYAVVGDKITITLPIIDPDDHICHIPPPDRLCMNALQEHDVTVNIYATDANGTIIGNSPIDTAKLTPQRLPPGNGKPQLTTMLKCELTVKDSWAGRYLKIVFDNNNDNEYEDIACPAQNHLFSKDQAPCDLSGYVARVVVPKVDLKSIEFTSDHESGGANILKDNNADWTDNGTAYVEPEWMKVPARNNPISHTKNTKLTAKVTVKVEPSGVTFDLIGDGPDGYVDFHENGNTSTGGDQDLTVTADDNLPDQVCTLTKSIDWKITAGATECGAGSSGGHKIYVTYGTPAGSEVTEMRVREVCTDADGQTGKKACADKIFDAHGNAFDLGADVWGPSPIWLLHLPTEKSQCPGVALFLNKHFEMLGLGAGEIKYCHAKADGTYAASATATGTNWRPIVPGTGHPDPTTHDDEYGYERFQMVDGDGNGNNFEATVWFEGHYYALPFTRSETTAKGLVKAVFTSMEWQYRTGASAPYTFHKCMEYPWVEAP